MSGRKSYLPDFVRLSIADHSHTESKSLRPLIKDSTCPLVHPDPIEGPVGHLYRAAVARTTLLQQEDLDGGSEGDSCSATVGPLVDASPDPEVDSRQGRAFNTESWQSGTPQFQAMKPEVEDLSIIVTIEPPGQMSADAWVKTRELHILLLDYLLTGRKTVGREESWRPSACVCHRK